MLTSNFTESIVLLKLNLYLSCNSHKSDCNFHLHLYFIYFVYKAVYILRLSPTFQEFCPNGTSS